MRCAHTCVPRWSVVQAYAGYRQAPSSLFPNVMDCLDLEEEHDDMLEQPVETPRSQQTIFKTLLVDVGECEET